jgi:lipopolysaccharide export system permease protein
MTYDRYLLRSFLHVFTVCLTSTLGLFVVIDLCENLDDFLARNGDRGTGALLWTIGECYAFQSIFFLDRAGPSLTVVSVMVVLVLLQRSGELHPLLASGIPMYRVLSPLIAGSAAFNALFALNQEFVIPQIAHAAFEKRGESGSTKHQVESLTDHSTRISIDGQSVRLGERTVDQAVFVLPSPTLVTEITILEASEAKFYPAKGLRPAGWLLRGVQPIPSEIERRLTDRGRALVRLQANSPHAFVATSVTCDQLFRRNSSFSLLSTPELIERIHSPAMGLVSVHRLVLHLHARLVQPVLNLIAVLIAIPLMVRRESPGLVADSALCGFVLALVFGLIQASQVLGASQIVPADLAAWIPVVFGGTIAAWLSGVIQS